jgi:hypothetical protein
MTGGAGQSSPLQGAETASGQKHPQSQIDVLTWPMWLAPPWGAHQVQHEGSGHRMGRCLRTEINPENKSSPERKPAT